MLAEAFNSEKQIKPLHPEKACCSIPADFRLSLYVLLPVMRSADIRDLITRGTHSFCVDKGKSSAHPFLNKNGSS